MDEQNIVELYNPDNAKNLTQAQVDAMKDFSNEQLKELAAAYKNKPNGNNYLILYNKQIPHNKQLFPTGTWQNLYNLRKGGSKNQFVAYSFDVIFNRKAARNVVPAKTAPLQDLTKDNLKTAEGVGLAPGLEVAIDYTEFSKKELQEKYTLMFGKKAGSSLTKDFLIAALQEGNNE